MCLVYGHCFVFTKHFFLKVYGTYFYSSCNGIIEVIVPTRDILFIKIHGRNIYLVLEPEGLYISKFCFFIFVFVWCNPLEIVNSYCPSFLLQDACQKAQKRICCTSFVPRAFSLYAPVLFSPLFSHPLLVHELLLYFMYLVVAVHFAGTMQNIKRQ